MNDDTKGAICEQWHTILALYDGDISRVGVAVYQRIFDAEPQLREVFGIPSFVTDLSEYEPFQRSGKLFMSVVDLCVRNIYALDAEMGPVLASLHHS
ncbi:unnamed protein product [Toxocara canis]|uniref:GLOBIN domain-containing protein n=1 Tax=Toxocara canis TaxID=6265 RepID=A0A183VA36_TOXCA|nr:unnamed protein product [Toxocara canis]